MTFSPEKIRTAPVSRPPIILVYSPNGHGKTTFVASIGKPFIIDTENKCVGLECPVYVPNSLNDVIECLGYLLNSEKFPGQALAIDSLDWLEKCIHENICNKYRVSNINEGTSEILNFGKGSKIASNEFNSSILSLLEKIRDKHNVPIIITAQAGKVPVNLPDREKHEIIDLRVDKVLAAFIGDKSDAKVYIQMRYFQDFKGVMHPSEERYLITRPQRGIIAKNSLHLPGEILIGEKTGWADFVAAIGTEGR